MQRPPSRVNVLEHTVFGLICRQIAWLAGSSPAALAVFFSILAGVDLVACGIAAVLLFGLGPTVAFGALDGQPPGVWPWQRLAYSRRSRYLVKCNRRSFEPHAVLAAVAAPASHWPRSNGLWSENPRPASAGRSTSPWLRAIMASERSSSRCSDLAKRRIQPRGIRGGTHPDSAVW